MIVLQQYCALALRLAPLPTRRFSNPIASSNQPEINQAPRDKDLDYIAGIGGCFSSVVVLYSEFTLKTTGCGLPAGPFGILGLSEGLSYIGIVLVVGWSLFTKAQTGKGLPPGPYNLLGAAEGLSYLSACVGLVVLGFQLRDFGFIPEALPVEGGLCSGGV